MIQCTQETPKLEDETEREYRLVWTKTAEHIVDSQHIHSNREDKLKTGFQASRNQFEKKKTSNFTSQSKMSLLEQQVLMPPQKG